MYSFLGLDHWNIKQYDREARTPLLELMKNHLIRGEVVFVHADRRTPEQSALQLFLWPWQEPHKVVEDPEIPDLQLSCSGRTESPQEIDVCKIDPEDAQVGREQHTANQRPPKRASARFLSRESKGPEAGVQGQEHLHPRRDQTLQRRHERNQRLFRRPLQMTSSADLRGGTRSARTAQQQIEAAKWAAQADGRNLPFCARRCPGIRGSCGSSPVDVLANYARHQLT